MKKALLTVDVQNDFCPGGALAVPGGDQVIEPLNRMIWRAKTNGWPILASRDWHPAEHCSFKEQGGPWPSHCIQNTPGAEFHPALKIDPRRFREIVISKGFKLAEDSYSAFGGSMEHNMGLVIWTIDLEQILKTENVTTLYIGGLATDYCVKATALDAVRKGFKAYLLTDACRAVNIKPGDEALALNEMENAGVQFATTDEVIYGEETR